MLTSVLKAIINKPFQEKFDFTFMGNKKYCQNINFLFLFFSYKYFSKIIHKQMSLSIL